MAVNPYRPTTSATILPFTPRRAPAGQWLPEEIAEIVLFLASTAGRFMTGQIVSTRMRHGA